MLRITPQETQEGSKFNDFYLNPEDIVDIEVKKRSIIIYIDNGAINKIVIRDKALNQLFKLLFGNVRETKKLMKTSGDSFSELVKTKLKERGDDIVLSAVEVSDAPGVWVAFRATTKDYTPIPHSTLFLFAEGMLQQLGVEWIEKKVVKFMRRTAIRFLLYEVPLNYARPGDALRLYLVISNANNAQDSIHVYGYGEIFACKNGLIVEKNALSVHIVHRGSVADILVRVGRAIRRVLSRLAEDYKVVAKRIESLQDVPLSKELVWIWLEQIIRKHRIPKKYAGWFERVLEQYVEEFGYNAEAVFQTLTYFVTRLNSKHYARGLNAEALRLLESPREYVAAVAAVAAGRR